MLALRRAITKTSTLHFSTSAKRHPPPSTAYYDDLIDSAGRSRDFAALQELLNKRTQANCFNTSTTFNFIATDLSILNDLLNCLSHLKTGGARKCAYNSLIAQLSKLHETRKALKVAATLVKNEIGVKAMSFHPILNATTKKREMEEAWRVLDTMRGFKIEPDTTSYNYLLTAYCCSRDLKSAGEVVEKMRETGLKEDDRTYDALVLGACKAGKMEAALMLMRRMLDDGVTPIYSTYAHVISGMCCEGYYAQAVEFVRTYAGRDEKLDAENFGLLGAKLVAFKRVDELKIVVEEMYDRNLLIAQKLRDFYQLHVASW